MENMDNERGIDRIMGSIDGLEKAGVLDFFYTRLKGRMQREMEGKRKPFFLLRPAFVTGALSVVLVINIIFLTQMNQQHQQNKTAPPNKPATIESFAKAYDLDATSLYE